MHELSKLILLTCTLQSGALYSKRTTANLASHHSFGCKLIYKNEDNIGKLSDVELTGFAAALKAVDFVKESPDWGGGGAETGIFGSRPLDYCASN